MLQQDEPDDYVVATGETHSVREFCERAFAPRRLPAPLDGVRSRRDGRRREDRAPSASRVDPRYFRPAEVDVLLGRARVLRPRVRARWPAAHAGRGSGADETGRRRGERHAVRVRVDPRYFRPAEVDLLLGDASKATRELGWTPNVTFAGLVDMMTDADLEKARKEASPPSRQCDGTLNASVARKSGNAPVDSNGAVERGIERAGGRLRRRRGEVRRHATLVEGEPARRVERPGRPAGGLEALRDERPEDVALRRARRPGRGRSGRRTRRLAGRRRTPLRGPPSRRRGRARRASSR